MKEIVESSPAGGDPGGLSRHSGQPGGQPGLRAEISQADASQATGLKDDLSALIENEVNRRF